MAERRTIECPDCGPVEATAFLCGKQPPTADDLAQVDSFLLDMHRLAEHSEP